MYTFGPRFIKRNEHGRVRNGVRKFSSFRAPLFSPPVVSTDVLIEFRNETKLDFQTKLRF